MSCVISSVDIDYPSLGEAVRNRRLPKFQNEGYDLIRETDLLSSNSFYSLENSPNNYVKPLDVVKMFIFQDSEDVKVHSGIYLGSNKVIHMSAAGGAGFSTKALWKNLGLQQSSTEKGKVEIVD